MNNFCTFLVTIVVVLATNLGHAPRVEAQAENLSKHPVLIIISFDGFRYDYMTKTDTPSLDWVKQNGVSVPYMQNQFMTNTFPNHHSMATGLYIESHGIVGNVLFDPVYNMTLSGYNDDPGFWNYSSSVIPIYTWNQMAGDDRHSGVHMWTGSFEPYGDQNTVSTYRHKYDGSYLFEARIDDVVNWITDPVKPANLVMLYFQEPDSAGHDCGPESAEIVTQIKRMDDLTGYLLAKLDMAKIKDKVNLIITSDHGMQEVRQDDVGKFIDLNQLIDGSIRQKYRNHGTTPLFQLLPFDEADTQEIYAAFKVAAEENGHFSVYLKGETKTLHPNWHYADSRRIMPILVVAEPGYTFTKYTREHPDENPNEIPRARACALPYKGQHGYDNSSPAMRPFFVAIGPLFKDGGRIEEPFQNIDIFPLVSHMMGLPDHPTNGSFSRICPILRDTVCNAGQTVKGMGTMVMMIQVLTILGIFRLFGFY